MTNDRGGIRYAVIVFPNVAIKPGVLVGIAECGISKSDESMMMPIAKKKYFLS